MKRLAIITSSILLLTSSALAAVPLRWTVETSRAQPATFDEFAGATYDLEATLQSYGRPLEVVGDPHLYWQTNGMASAWWSAPATVSGNVLRATWTPACDVGARAYNCFIGITGTVYNAAFQLRLRPSPGATPNALPLPTPVIDFSRVTVLNPPWSGGSGSNLDTNTVADIANHAIATNETVQSHSSQLSQLSQKVGACLPMTNETGTAWVGWDGDILNFSYGIQVQASPCSFPAELDGFLFGEQTMKSLLDEKRDVDDNEFNGHVHIESGSLELDSPFGIAAHYLSMGTHDTFDEGWSSLSVTTGESTETLPEYLDRRLPSSPSLRVYDAARGCWWIGAMVDGVINWTVEE